MGFTKGRTKTGGRTKGTPNRTTSEIRTLIAEGLSDHLDRIGEYLDELPPHERLNAMGKLLRYILPREIKKEVTSNEREQVFQIGDQVIRF